MLSVQVEMEDVFCQELSWKIDEQGLTVGLFRCKNDCQYEDEAGDSNGLRLKRLMS